MKIENSTSQDIEEIFRLYRLATEFQKTRFTVHWPEFDRTMVETEIAEKRQWKIIIDNQVACVWATTFDDPQIWEEKNADPAVYIHRIATNPVFRGNSLVERIVESAKEYARLHQKRFVRLDTVGNNPGLIAYYTKCGFDFLGLLKLKSTAGLPAHYDNATVSLFEIDLEGASPVVNNKEHTR
ncbi:Acetyltransferase (GNAT) family protein [Chitinophaga arvensicola]|uniref:Acetyltransferase (GNAT) family protein n=2 Tax=Chitinophaga arvensicola TaxID=29529 RepID=A0A1I0S741_9BACT|nr:Acetyltransferase (GNAT) family protein [Chitinophaga arvensicola]